MRALPCEARQFAPCHLPQAVHRRINFEIRSKASIAANLGAIVIVQDKRDAIANLAYSESDDGAPGATMI
jgi:hypothetical protein